ncbi:MAG: hypothetical protein IT374_20765 [Polyangiaceae bacterium]|nr:hypothetical protein [Polyangiaceae bacterium]
MRRAVAVAVAAIALGCDGATERDRLTLLRVVALDQEASRALHGADELVAKGRAKEASEVLARDARPKVERAAAELTAHEPTSSWGKQRAGDVRAVLRARRESLDAYAAALASDDVQRVIDALEAQKPVEARAMAVAAAVRAGP